MLTSSMRIQSVARVGGTIGVHNAFFSASSSKVASTCAMSAALKTVPKLRSHCGVMRSPAQMGTLSTLGIPAALQSTTSVPGGSGMLPCSRWIRSASMDSTRPSRTTPSMRRSWASSALLRMAPWKTVGVTRGSIRIHSPAASSRSIRSGTLSAATIASSCRVKLPQVFRKNSSLAWTLARSKTQESRGMIQRMSSGSTPCSSSQMQASMPVLPAPTTT